MAELGVWDRGSGEGLSALKIHNLRSAPMLFSYTAGTAF